MGRYFHESEVYTEALEQYNLALEQLKSDSEDTLSVVLRNHIGEIHLFLKNYSKARKYLNESKNFAEKFKYDRGVAIAETLLGSCYEKERNYLKALEHQEKSLSIFETLDDKKGIATVHENIGSIYEDLGRYDKAYNYFKKSFDYFESINSVQRIQVVNNIGDVFRKTDNYPKALQYTGEALRLAEVHGEIHQLESAHKDLSEIYALMQDFENSYKHLKAYTDIHKESFYSNNFRQLNVLQTVYETNQKEAQIALLTQQSEVSKANQQLLMLGTGMILALSGISYFHINRKRKGKIKLQQYEQRLLQAKLDQKAIEEEKLQNEVHIKTASLSRYSLNLAQKNKLISDVSSTLKNISERPKMDLHSHLKQVVKELDDNLQKEEEWDEFLNFFKDIHPNFIKNLSSASEGDLTSAELRLAMLLRLNLSSKEIAAILRVTPDSVRVARYRLRKKLPIRTKQELVNYMLEL